MHKYSAKTLFVGKKLQYLTQCHSSNEEMALSVKNGNPKNGQALVTGYQTGGKGQRGNSWNSEADKNILTSIYLQTDFLSTNQIYLLNVAVSLALRETLLSFIPDSHIEIKWPNDIYVNNKKVAGVLIESNMIQSTINYVIVGIGLNVNQINFLSNEITSMKLVTNQAYELSVVLDALFQQIEEKYLALKANEIKRLIFDYHQAMRWRGELRSFKTSLGVFTGEIIGINNKGMLMLKHNSELRSYDIQEIKFLH